MSRMKRLRLLPAGSFILLSLFGTQTVSSAETGLAGTVTSNGEPLEGVAVSARAGDKTFTTTVYTDQKGEYVFPALDTGHYRIWAQAVGFEAGRSEVKLTGNKKVQQDFSLKTLHDFRRQLSGAEWLTSLPEETPLERQGKAILNSTCSGCHSSNLPLQNRFSSEDWGLILDYMENIPAPKHWGSIWTPSTYNPGEFVGFYKEEARWYLTRVLGPEPFPLKFKPFPRPSGEATRVVITEYDIPLVERSRYEKTHDGTDWSLGPPSKYGGFGAAHDVVVDKDGMAWFADNVSPKRTLGRLDPRTGQVKNYVLYTEENQAVGAHGITFDQKGNIWLTNTPEMSTLKFDPVAEKFQRFPQPSSLPPGGGRTIEVDSKGNPWVNAAGGVMKLDPKTAEYTFYKSITNASPGVSGSYYGLSIDGKDNVWFTMITKDRVGVVDGATGEVSEIYLGKESFEGTRFPTFEASSSVGPPNHKGPRKLRADRRGDSVWVPEFIAGKLAKIDINTHKVTEYPLPYRYTKPYAAGVDKHHMVWIVGLNSDHVYKFNPFTERWTSYRIPSLGMDMRHVEIDNSTDPPSIWTAYFKVNKVVRLQFRE